jgi:hypothetical protein
MPLERTPDGHFAVPLAHRLTVNATAAEVAAACAAIWVDLDAALKPIIGARGVAALLWRSLHLVSTTYPWLPAAPPVDAFAFDPAPLCAVLAQRPVEEAAAATHSFLQTFRQLLVSLIGASLTERLLRAAWGPPTEPSPESATAQDLPR